MENYFIGSIARHKSYVKHFIGPDVLLSKPQTRSQNKQGKYYLCGTQIITWC